MKLNEDFTINANMILVMGLLRVRYGEQFVEERADAFRDLVPWIPVTDYEWELEQKPDFKIVYE